jgi:hypothetical protein
MQRSHLSLEAKKPALIEMEPRIPGVLPTVASLSQHERKNFSVAKALSSEIRGLKKNSLEREVSNSVSKDVSKLTGVPTTDHGGVWLPFQI